MSINDQFDNEMKDINPNRGLDYYKFQEGDNRIRILSEGAIIASHFFGKGVRPSICYGINKGCPFHKEDDKSASVKYSCYILDRVDDQIKLADIPYSIIKKVGDLQLDSEWSFEYFPMPYDIKVVYKPNESPANMYSVVASPKRDPLSQIVVDKLGELLTKSNPAELVKNKKLRQMSEHKDQGIWEEPSTLSEEDKAEINRIRDKALGAQHKSSIDTRVDESDRDINPEDIPF